MQYIALIHRHTDTTPTAEEWELFFVAAKATAMFKGGSEIGARQTIGRCMVPDTGKSVGGYMRFDADDPGQLNALLQDHPVIKHGGTIELFEMPTS